MYAHTPPSSPSREGRANAILQFGTAVGLGVAGSMVCALPATVRLADIVASTEGLPRVWVALAADALGPMIATVLVLRAARESARAFTQGAEGELRAYGVGLWLASLLVMLAIFAGVLRATTHHHALAGVTYAFGALAVSIGWGLVCARLVVILRDMSERSRRIVGGAMVVTTGAALTWVAVRFLRAASEDSSSAAAAATVVDVLAFAIAAAFAARPSLAFQRVPALVGPPVALAVLALGLSTLHDAPLRAAIGEHAPAYSPVADLVAGP
jgi:hypothetical protein